MNQTNDKPVYEALAEHQETENWQFQAIAMDARLWVEKFVSEFKLDIGPISLCIDRLSRNTLGHFRAKHNGFGLLGEIAINSTHLQQVQAGDKAGQPQDKAEKTGIGVKLHWDAIGTLFHELLHAHQEHVGTASSGNHHNKDFQDMAAAFGLLVDRYGVTTYDPDGKFIALLKQHQVRVPDIFQPMSTHRAKPKGTGMSKLAKWVCDCKPPVNLRVGKDSIHVQCLDCKQVFRKVPGSSPPAVAQEQGGAPKPAGSSSASEIDITTAVSPAVVEATPAINADQEVITSIHEPPVLIAHDLGGGHLFYSGTLPKELALGPARFEELWLLHPEEYHEIMIHGRLVKTPRWQQAYVADYHYTGRRNKALPLPSLLKPIWEWAQAAIDNRLQGALLNWYEGKLGHYIGAHRDSRANMVVGTPIVTISMGEERTFRLRPWKGLGYRDFRATNGTVFIMPYDTNLHFTHEVAHAVKYCGRRISVTLRAFERSVLTGAVGETEAAGAGPA